jgi:hypothetical protein
MVRCVARNVVGSKICTHNREWETSVEVCTWQKVLEEYRVNVGTGLNYLKIGPGGGILWLQLWTFGLFLTARMTRPCFEYHAP